MATISTTIKINDAFSNPLDKLSAGLSKSQSGFQRLKSALSGAGFGGAQKQSDGLFKSMTGGVVVGNLISKGMGLASQGIHSMIGELNEASISWQTFEGNMRQIGKSPAEIASAKKDMQKFAQQTIYSASDMSTTYSQLAAVGVKNTGKLVKGFGGLAASAANPAQAMKTISEQATQMAAKPKVQWMDFKLMLEQAPAGMSAVAKSMGMSLTQLIQKIQDGKVKTQDFLDAVAKTGTNANFSKMATEYKTVDQAMDGLKETLANGLQPQFQKLSQIGIKAISSLTDQLANLNWDAFGDGLVNAVNYVKPALDALRNGVQDFFDGFKSTGVGDSLLDMFHSISDAVMDVSNTMSGGNKKGSFFTQLGKLSGGALSTVAQGISGIADAVGGLDPDTLLALARAFIILKGGLKGLILTEVVKGLAKLNEADPGTINALAKSLTALALAFVIFKAVYQGVKAFGKIKDVISGIGSIKAPKMSAPDVPKSGGILQSAGAFLKLGAALLMVGGAVALVAVGFKLLADSATQLASGGGTAIAVFFGMIAAIAALAIVVRLLGTGMLGASIGFLVFAAALLVIAAAIWVASAGLAMLSSALPNIATYGFTAAGAIAVLAVAIALFGVLAIVGAIGIVLLGVALIVAAAGMMIAAVGAMVLAVGLALLGVMAIVAGAGLLILGVGLALVAITIMVAAVGVMLFGVSLVLVAAMSMLAAVGVILLGVGLVLVGAMAMLAAVGLLLLGVGLALVAAVAMIAGVGLLLVGVGLMMVGVGAAIAAPGIKSISDSLSKLADSLSGGISRILDSIANVISSIGDAAYNAGMGISLMADGLQTMSSIGIGRLATLLASLAVGLGKIASLGGNLSSAGSGMAQLASSTMMAVVALQMLKSLGNITINPPKVNMSGVSTAVMAGMLAAAAAATAGGAQLVAAVRSAVMRAVATARSAAGAMHSAGVMIGAGLAAGIRSQIGAVAAAADALVAQADRAARAKARIHSPSRLFAEVGDYIGQGMAIGMNGTMGLINQASQAMIDAAYPGKVNDVGLGNVGGYGIGSDYIGSNSITPSSLTTNNGGNTTNNSREVHIGQGAITINSTGNAEYDADRMLEALEQKIIEQQDKSLG